VTKKPFKFLLSEKERKILQTMATESGITAGAWLRLQIHNAARAASEAAASRKQPRSQ
jgi:hypothetical protein